MNKLLADCKVYPSKQVMYKAHWGPTYYRNMEDNMPIAVSQERVTCVEILMPEETWDRIAEIVHMFEQEQENPVLKEMADQYRMMRLLIQERKDGR